jgi:hypothetical protein
MSERSQILADKSRLEEKLGQNVSTKLEMKLSML